MYEELIKQLRWMEDVCKKDISCPVPCINECLFKEAADVIEGLSHAVDQMTEWRKNQWISAVKHGRWEDSIAEYGILIHICSVCNKHSHMAYNYCPNCGARMDVEDDV